MQQPTHPMAQISPANITTEQIQKYLDENKQLILAILDNQNLGKLAECAQYQAQLQKNLLYLAAIADAQPPTPSVRPQVVPHQAMQLGGGPFMHQGPIFPPRPLMQRQPPLMPLAGHMGIRPGGVTNGMQSSLHHHAQSSSHGSSIGDLTPGSSMIESSRGSGLASSSMDGQGSKPDVGEAAEILVAGGADNLRNSDGEHATGDATEPPPTYLKRSKGSPNNKTS